MLSLDKLPIQINFHQIRWVYTQVLCCMPSSIQWHNMYDFCNLIRVPLFFFRPNSYVVYIYSPCRRPIGPAKTSFAPLRQTGTSFLNTDSRLFFFSSFICHAMLFVVPLLVSYASSVLEPSAQGPQRRRAYSISATIEFFMISTEFTYM